MKNNTIKLTLGDWQWNASIVGFINIVGQENVNIVADDTVEVSPEVLNGFEDKYFTYFINTYERILSLYKIISFKDKILSYEENNLENFNLKALQNLNVYIRDIKRFIKSNSYKAAYELINLDVDMLSLEKQLAAIKEPKNEQQFDANRDQIIAEVKHVFSVLKQIIQYCDSPIGKMHIAAKNVIYTIINNAWNGVSFLNAQTKEKDPYVDYKTYFVDSAIDYLKNDKSKYKYNCFICDAPIKDLSNNLSFLNATGFDVAKKSSHVWDFQNDIAICPVCKLIYSCLPAGMTYIYDRGIYVNANIRLRDALNINYKIKKDILSSLEGGIRSVYHSLVGALQEKENNTAKYELADVQVVRYEKETYRFNILSRKMQEIIVKSEKELNSLIKTSFSDNGATIQIYDEVISRIFNNQNLFTLIHKMLYHKLSEPSKCYFNGMHVNYLLLMNRKVYRSLGGMKMSKTWDQEQENNYIVKSAKAAGSNLKKEYINKRSDNKLPGICYHLLNALKTSNTDMFMDVVLNCYLYVKIQVPKVITDVLGREKDFSTMGYAFVSGLIDGQDMNVNTEGKVRGEEK